MFSSAPRFTPLLQRRPYQGWFIPLALVMTLYAVSAGADEELSEAELEAFSVSATGAVERLYQEKCARCHGARGDGNGPFAAYLTPRPTDFRSSNWQTRSSDERLRLVILDGGGALGKSLLMPAFPELRGQVQLLRVLIKKLRRFRVRENASRTAPRLPSDTLNVQR